MKGNLIYYVEGETEKRLIEALKENFIYSGKIKIKNVIQEKITTRELREISPNTTVVIIVDTDINKIDIFGENIDKLEKERNIKKVIKIFQIKNLEDEIIYSTSIKKIVELIPSRSNSDFKSDFCKCKNIINKLEDKNFDIHLLWNRSPKEMFSRYENEGSLIKNKKSRILV